jgi:hypothetical protein
MPRRVPEEYTASGGGGSIDFYMPKELRIEGVEPKILLGR